MKTVKLRITQTMTFEMKVSVTDTQLAKLNDEDFYPDYHFESIDKYSDSEADYEWELVNEEPPENENIDWYIENLIED